MGRAGGLVRVYSRVVGAGFRLAGSHGTSPPRGAERSKRSLRLAGLCLWKPSDDPQRPARFREICWTLSGSVFRRSFCGVRHGCGRRRCVAASRGIETMSRTEAGTTQDVFDVAAFINSRHVGAVQYGIIILCGLMMFLDGFDTQAISYIAPRIAREWGLSPELLGPIFSSALIGLIVS